ncbi:MAG: response regulator [Planctomycetes bacterium]|nr:response regulator [Planctomycetota bacterium]
MSSDADSPADPSPADGRDSLLKKLQRALRQTRREQLRAENLALRSKQAMLGTNRHLENSIRELERTMAELSEAKAAAERASAAKGRFVATISHELRTPMNGILGTAELLTHTELTEEQRELVSIVQRSAQGLLSIINDVLDLSKAESGKMELESTRFDLHGALRAVVDLQLNAARGKRLVLRSKVDPAVPRWVIGDPVRLRQVLLNLLDNALKFTAEGGVTLAVRPGAQPDRLQFMVEDTGIGIPAEHQGRIFDPFVQADSSTTRRFGGSGLGLAICRDLVSLMGGTLQLESTVGVGTRFHFEARFPAAEDDVPGAGTRTVPRVICNLGLRVLVVDDNAVNRMIARRMLERLGCNTAEAENGLVAVERAQTADWDVILMDCSMPVLDGYEATLAIRAFDGPRARVKIVATTAHAFSADRERCFQVGMDEFITKPMQMAQLHELLARLCLAGDPRTSSAV